MELVILLFEMENKDIKQKTSSFIHFYKMRIRMKVFCYVLQEVDESGAEMFSILLPVGTPLPARRHHTFSAQGRLSSLCLEVYQRVATQQPQKLSKVIRIVALYSGEF